MTITEAAHTLDLTVEEITELADEGRLPARVTAGGVVDVSIPDSFRPSWGVLTAWRDRQ